ncbi:hypothetical protein, conserved [Leishmania donovani]|uniref:EF-hand domain-containing protein n=1 Tax=Leishmania donovani TaxID=5661 RepID=A0A3Q8IKE9_LEIDO|nr:hypothetical protein, conserved [Leishmania donovani]AYU83496.1 hypothetical protein LdCL_360020600 [Leishmania donovani]TPP48262.1 hypothetical protein CGC21_13060 [Leishmania donovani]CBZ38589.1 hypothetical protein, conserved [Leishmania donovani]
MSAVASDDSAGHVVDPVQHTHRYIQEHKLNELFGHLLQLVLYHRPDDPRAFLAEEVRRIREEKVSSSLFTERDLETMFETIDVTAQRWITVAQLRNTCRNLATASSAGTGSTGGGGLTAEQEAAIAGAGDAAGRVTMENFKGVLSSLLLTKNKWS